MNQYKKIVCLFQFIYFFFFLTFFFCSLFQMSGSSDSSDYFVKPSIRKRTNIASNKQKPNLVKPVTHQYDSSINQIIKNRPPLKTIKADIIPDLGLNIKVASSYSIDSYGKIQVIPPISTFPKDKFDDVLYQKIEQCLKICNFKDYFNYLNGKATKQDYLTEILGYIKDPEYYKMMSLRTHEMLFRMFTKNVIRVLPPVPELVTAPSLGDDIVDNYSEDAWPHLEIVYSIFLEYLKSPAFDEKYIIKKITPKFINDFIGLFHALDKRERSMLQLTLYSMYSRLIHKRREFRVAIKSILNEIHFEGKYIAGMPELLNILQPIISGYSLPLASEHVDFLFSTLLPLMSSNYLQFFYKSFVNCVLLYLTKDISLLTRVYNIMEKYWPVFNNMKESIFLYILREILKAISRQQFKEIMLTLMKRIGLCSISEHYIIADAALRLWSLDNFVKYVKFYSNELIPIICPYLYQSASNHWNNQIRGLANCTIRICIQINPQIVDKICSDMGITRSNRIKKQEKKNNDDWSIIKVMAKQNDPSIEETQFSFENI